MRCRHDYEVISSKDTPRYTFEHMWCVKCGLLRTETYDAKEGLSRFQYRKPQMLKEGANLQQTTDKVTA